METATSNTTYVTPGRAQYHPSSCKSWVRFYHSTGTPTNQGSYNVSSITDSGVGYGKINFTVAFSSATTYCGVGMSQFTGVANHIGVMANLGSASGGADPTTSAFTWGIYDCVNGSLFTLADMTDDAGNGLVFFGDQ
jgi:hypothetical protein